MTAKYDTEEERLAALKASNKKWRGSLSPERRAKEREYQRDWYRQKQLKIRDNEELLKRYIEKYGELKD